MNTIWKDGSSYKIGEQKIPNIWIAEVGVLRISVVYNHVCYPDQWIFTCEPFFEQEELGDISAEKAQTKALELVSSAFKDTLSDLE